MGGYTLYVLKIKTFSFQMLLNGIMEDLGNRHLILSYLILSYLILSYVVFSEMEGKGKSSDIFKSVRL